MKIIVFLFLVACTSLRLPKQQCPVPEVRQSRPTVFYIDFLKAHKIQLVNDVESRYLDLVITDYLLVPKTIMSELLEEDTRMHLLTGNSVTDDPTWDKKITKSYHNDPRTFDSIIATGGKPYLQKASSKLNGDLRNYFAWMRKFCVKYPRAKDCKADFSDSALKSKLLGTDFPVRIVVNRMDAYGNSTVLHELGHSIDNLYAQDMISGTTRWQKLLVREKKSTEFLLMLCENGYCHENKAEGFAELFSYYHSCQETREHLKKEVPEIAKFFKSFESVREFKKLE